MSVVSIEKYQVVTGDTVSASATVQTWLDSAEAMLEEHLGRKFAYGNYTETLRVWENGFAYPSAVPVVAVASSGSYQIYDEATLEGVQRDSVDYLEYVALDHWGEWLGQPIGTDYETYLRWGTVSYTGGWTIDTMPEKLQFWICKLARALDPAYSDTRPIGAQLVRVGDVQVSYQADQIAGPLDQFVPGLSRAVAGYRLRR